MAANWVTFFGEELLTKEGVKKTAVALEGKKLVAIYFSAHWCPPCRGFTPSLGEFYNAVKAEGGDELEIVFVSSDQDQSQFDGYYASMPFIALPFTNRAAKQQLGEKYGVRGIPTLLILDANGNTVDSEGRGTVMANLETVKAALTKWTK